MRPVLMLSGAALFLVAAVFSFNERDAQSQEPGEYRVVVPNLVRNPEPTAMPTQTPTPTPSPVATPTAPGSGGDTCADELAYGAAVITGLSDLSAAMDDLLVLFEEADLTSSAWQLDLYLAAQGALNAAELLRDLESPSPNWAAYESALHAASAAYAEAFTLIRDGAISFDLVLMQQALIELEEANALIGLLPDSPGFDCGGAPSPTPPAGPVTTFGSGIQSVGTDIQPGTYRAVATDFCYWERLSGFSDELDDIIANDIGQGVHVVTIRAADTAFNSNRCGTWTTDLSPIASPSGPISVQGTLVVGTDIAPGRWRAPGGEGCYWERLSGFSGEFDDIIDNDFGSAGPVVQIAASDEGFHSNECGTWTKIG